MAKEAFIVGWDLQHGGAGYDNVSKTKGSTAATINSWEPVEGTGGGLHATVFRGLICKIEAESLEEAMKFAAEAYGSKGGFALAAKSSNVEFKNA